MSKQGVYGDAEGDTGFRRKFKADDYKNKKTRQESTQNAIHDHLALEQHINRTQVVSTAGARSQQAGIYCPHCDLNFKDNMAYLEHQRSKEHQRKMGLSLTVRTATLEDVKDKFEELRQRRDAEGVAFDFNKRLEWIRQMEQEEKEQRKRKRKEAKARKRNDDDNNLIPGSDPVSGADAQEATTEADLMATLGFTGFGGSRK